MRRRFLINPKLQIPHLLWTVGVVVVCTLVGYILFESILRSTLASRLTAPQDWLEVRNLLRMGFVIVLLLLSIAVGIENYLLFHSIVGPLYALEKGLKNVAEGNLDEEVKIRNHDKLKDLIQAFEDMKKSLRLRLKASNQSRP